MNSLQMVVVTASERGRLLGGLRKEVRAIIIRLWLS